MTPKLSPIQSRLAALSLLLFVICVLVLAVALPTAWLHKRYNTFLGDYTDQITRYRRVAALRPGIEEAITEVEKTDSRKFYLKSASPSLAAAELQGLVTRIIESHKGRVASSQIQQAKDDTKPIGPAKVGITVQMNATAVSLQLVLHAIESHEPYLFIDQVTVRANQGRGYKPVPGVQPEFSVQMTISGHSPIEGDKR